MWLYFFCCWLGFPGFLPLSVLQLTPTPARFNSSFEKLCTTHSWAGHKRPTHDLPPPCVLSFFSRWVALSSQVKTSDSQVLAIMICASMGGLVKRGADADSEVDPHRFWCLSKALTSVQKAGQERCRCRGQSRSWSSQVLMLILLTFRPAISLDADVWMDLE